MGRSRCRGNGAVTSSENFLYVDLGRTALTHHEKGPYQIAHHVVQKAAASHFINKLSAITFPL